MAPTEHGEITCDDALLRSGFVQVPVIILRSDKLGAGAKLAYGLLLWYLWKKETYPGHRLAAEEFGIPERSLKRYISELVQSGLVIARRAGLGETNSYHLPDPRAILALQEGQYDPSEGPKRPASNDNTSTTYSNNEDESLSLSSQIATTYSNGKRDARALTTSLSKYPVSVLERVATEVGKRIAADEVKNPGAYCNRLAQVFTEAEQQEIAVNGKRRQALFDTILATATFEAQGKTPAALRRALLAYWPGEAELVERAVELVAQ